MRVLRILYLPYKWIIFFPVVALSTFIFGSLAAILAFLISSKNASFLSGVPWARVIAFFTPIYVGIQGRENIDKKQSYIIVCNHQSQYDIIVIYGWMGVDFKWVMKKELRRVPFLGVACERLGHIFIDRSNHKGSLASLDGAKKKIVNGTSVMFFPEGTRSRDGIVGNFKKGAFRMAIDLGLPILPVTIKGTREILPTETLSVFPGKAKMIIHKPIDIAKYDDGNISELVENTRKIIISGLGEESGFAN